MQLILIYCDLTVMVDACGRQQLIKWKCYVLAHLPDTQAPTQWNLMGYSLTACVNNQLYSLITFLSLPFHFHNKKFAARLKNIIFSYFLKKLHNLNVYTSFPRSI